MCSCVCVCLHAVWAFVWSPENASGSLPQSLSTVTFATSSLQKTGAL